jgi:hypothetical protein
MFGELPEYLRKRHKNDVPSIGALDDIRLPGAAIYATPEIIEPKGREAVLDNSAVLDDITNKALTRLSEVLEGDWSGDPKEDAIMMDAVRLTLTTQLRVDDSRLKKRTTDTLAQLLQRMDREDANLKVINA